MHKLSFVICVIFSGLVSGCSFFQNEYPSPKFNNGILILQTETTASNTSYLSYLDSTGNNFIQNIFLMQNKNGLGNGANAMSLYNGRGYVMLSQEGKIVVFNGATVEKIGTIEGEAENNLVQCRNFAPINENKAYVTCWGNTSIPPSVAVIDLQTLKVTKNIILKAGSNPELILTKANYAYVTLSGENHVALINTDTDSENVKLIEVGKNPRGIVLDQLKHVWVLNNDSLKSLMTIDTLAASILISIKFSNINSQLGNLSINQTGDILYFSMTTPGQTKLDSIYRFPIVNNTFNPQVKNAIARQVVERMKIDPNSNILYVSGTTHSKKGYVIRYKLPAANITGAVSKTDSLSFISTPVDFNFYPKVK
jgi:YVTN family beta-propeller protein